MAVVIEAVVLFLAFRYECAETYKVQNRGQTMHESNEFGDIITRPVTWVCAAYFLAYVGTEGRCIEKPSSSIPTEP